MEQVSMSFAVRLDIKCPLFQLCHDEQKEVFNELENLVTQIQQTKDNSQRNWALSYL